jgi:hypothetical protein
MSKDIPAPGEGCDRKLALAILATLVAMARHLPAMTTYILTGREPSTED